MSNLYFAANTKALFDTWFLGDEFLRFMHQNLQEKQNELQLHMKVEATYLSQYYNLHAFYKLLTFEARSACARIISALIEAVNEHHILPHFLIVMLDSDLITDLHDKRYDQASEALDTIVPWLTKQIKKIVARKRMQIMEKKPGAVFTGDPKIIYVRMLRRNMQLDNQSIMGSIRPLTNKFAAILNDAISELDQNIMTIISCSSPENDHKWGNPSVKGAKAFWKEVDDLLQKFNLNKIKLVPNQKKSREFHSPHHHSHCHKDNKTSKFRSHSRNKSRSRSSSTEMHDSARHGSTRECSPRPGYSKWCY